MSIHCTLLSHCLLSICQPRLFTIRYTHAHNYCMYVLGRSSSCLNRIKQTHLHQPTAGPTPPISLLLPEILNILPIEPPQLMLSSAPHYWESSCAMQILWVEAPQNVLHWETIDEDLQSAYSQRTNVHMALITPDMEGCQGLFMQGLETVVCGSATIWWCQCPLLHRQAYCSSNASIWKTSLPRHPSAKGTGGSGHNWTTAPLLVGIPCQHWVECWVVVQAQLSDAFCSTCLSIHYFI